MQPSNSTSSEKSQSDKFKEVASDLDCDTDEERWGATLKKVVKHKPIEKAKQPEQ
jgi:hypothetical protein